MPGLRYISASKCRFGLAALVILATVSRAHADRTFGCTAAMADRTPFGWGYFTYISYGASQSAEVTRKEEKCGADLPRSGGPTQPGPR